MTVMQDEIFGPILPVHAYGALEDAITFVNDRPRPLALYYFGHDPGDVGRVLDETVSGGVCVNETLLHVGVDDLPFGGVGPSGIGHYHGREGFESLSKMKPVFHQARINGSALMRPPFGAVADGLLRVLVGR
jgi:acyl-CoA reductase-like NAD-dependent aldehyde dehydrogenase